MNQNTNDSGGHGPFDTHTLTVTGKNSKLLLAVQDATGWANANSAKIQLLDGATMEVDVRDTLKHGLTMRDATLQIDATRDTIDNQKRGLDLFGDVTIAVQAITNSAEASPTISRIIGAGGMSVRVGTTTFDIADNAVLCVDVPIIKCGDSQNTARNIVKKNAGRLILQKECYYLGTTTVNAGTLQIDAGASTGSGKTTIAETSTLAGSGTIKGALELASGATIDATKGAVTVNGVVTVNGTLNVVIGSLNAYIPVLKATAENLTALPEIAVTLDGQTVTNDVDISLTNGVIAITPKGATEAINSTEFIFTDAAVGTTKNFSDIVVDSRKYLAEGCDLTINFGDKGDTANPGTFIFDQAITFGTLTITGSNGGTIQTSAPIPCQTLNVQTSVKLPFELVNPCKTINFPEDKMPTLTLDVAQDATLTKALSGNFTFVKTGAGTLLLNENILPKGGSTIDAGTVKFGTVNSKKYYLGGNDDTSRGYTSASDVTVAKGAVLDFNGVPDSWVRNVTLQAGAVLANDSSSNISAGSRNLKSITLAGNATLRANADFALTASSYDPAEINLAGYTLQKIGSEKLIATNATVKAGTLEIQQGRFEYYNQKSSVTFADGVTIKIASGTGFEPGNETYQGAVTFDMAQGAQMTVASNIPGNVTKKGKGALTLSGVLSGETSTLDVNEGTLTLTGANTYNGATTIAKGAKVVANSGTSSTWDFKNAQTDAEIKVLGDLEISSTGELYRGFNGTGNIIINADSVIIGNTGDAGVSGLTNFSGNLIINSGKKLIVRTWNSNAYTMEMASVTVNGTLERNGGHSPNVSLTIAKLSGNGVITTNNEERPFSLTLANGAIIDATNGAVNVTGTVTYPTEGRITVKVPGVAETKVLGSTTATLPTSYVIKQGDETLTTVALVLGRDGIYSVVPLANDLDAATTKALETIATTNGLTHGVTSVDGEADAVAVFNNVVESVSNGGVVTLKDYNFGVSNITVDANKKLVVTATLASAADVSFAEGATVKLYKVVENVAQDGTVTETWTEITSTAKQTGNVITFTSTDNVETLLTLGETETSQTLQLKVKASK